jgi:hypothetical protein
MYSDLATKPVVVDLAALWKELGVKEGGEPAAAAPLAAVRRGITTRQ